MKSSEHAKEASRLNSIPEVDFLIPRKPILTNPALSFGDQDLGVDDPKHESSRQEDRSYTIPPAVAWHVPRWLHDWWPETLCCVLFAGGLLVIVAVVLPYQGQPLPQWPYNVSINTLISVLVSITKAAMLYVTAEGVSQLKWTWFRCKRPLQDLTRFDMASRGPWGSFRLLLRLCGRDLVTTVGAAVTVVSIAMDPFAQQVVRYDSCLIYTPSIQAALPRTNTYSETGVHMYAGINEVPPGVQGSINAGVFTPGATNISFNCPTGNCTFPQRYHSLAFCSTCVDNTPNLKIEATNNSNSSDESISYNYSLPSGMYSLAGTGDNNATSEMTLFLMQTSLYDQDDVEIIMNSWPDEEEYYTREDTAQCRASNNTLFGCNGIGAATCSLFPCVKTYNGLVKDGYVSENVESVWSSFDLTTDLLALDVGCLDPASRDLLIAQGHPIPPDSDWIAYNLSLDITYVNDTWAYRVPEIEEIVFGDCMYNFSILSLDSLRYFWSSYFSGNVSVPSASDQPQGSSSVIGVIWKSVLNDSDEFYASPTYQFQNLSQVFQDIAESLTLHIRENGDADSSVPVTGEIGHEETCVHIQWGWLALPFALVALTILFFIAMLFRTARHEDGFHGWKSSPLALIYHGLDLDTLKSQGQGSDIKDMKSDAQILQVRLMRTDQGWKLVDVCE